MFCKKYGRKSHPHGRKCKFTFKWILFYISRSNLRFLILSNIKKKWNFKFRSISVHHSVKQFYIVDKLIAKYWNFLQNYEDVDEQTCRHIAHLVQNTKFWQEWSSSETFPEFGKFFGQDHYDSIKAQIFVKMRNWDLFF